MNTDDELLVAGDRHGDAVTNEQPKTKPTEEKYTEAKKKKEEAIN